MNDLPAPVRRLVGADTETMLIAPGLQHPPIACMSICAEGGSPAVVPTPAAEQVLRALLSDPSVVTVWHNAVYDLGCAVAWWPGFARLVREAVEDDRILDTMLIERLAEIGGLTSPKSLSLASLYASHGLGALPKELPLPDGRPVRLSYGRLIGAPLSEYHPLQIEYAANDAVAPLKLLERQIRRWPEITPGKVSLLLKRLLPLADARAWGMRVNPDKLQSLAATAAAHLKELRAAAQTPMLLDGEHLPAGVEDRVRAVVQRGPLLDSDRAGQRELRQLNAILDQYRILRADGTKNMARLRAMVKEAYDGRPPMTEPPRAKKGEPARKKPFVAQVKTARSVLEESGDPRLEAFAEYGQWASIETSVVPALIRGTTEPLHTRWRVVDSCRISSSAPNLTNLSARNKAIRECLVPREGHVFLASDHEGLENATLAQVCVTELGRRGLADFYNERGNLHCLVAASIAGCTYDEAVALKASGDRTFLKGPYKCAKYLNFGMPGGAGWRRMQFTAAQMGRMTWTEAETRGYIAAHARAVPDLQAYLQWVKRQPQDSRGFQVQIPGTDIMRRGITFCSACNNGFQALGAIVQIHVGWELRRRILEGSGALSLCHLVNHPHDEWILECPVEAVHEAGEELQEVMVAEPRRVLPDVALRAETLAMRFWSKDAQRIVGPDGRLQIWPLEDDS